jgi:VanZ family protein
MPSFGGFDFSIKKFGHAFGYALLALAYQRGLTHTVQVQGSSMSSILYKNRSLVAWSLAILFAVTDEFHQSFVPGRNPSMWDILIFDNGGAILGLLINNLLAKKVKN